MIKYFKNFIKQNENKTNINFIQFLSNKKFINIKSKIFLYHSTNILPNNFVLYDEYNGENSNDWFNELPIGYLFLTTDINEAESYGKYIIPCELYKYDHIYFKVNSDNPSRIFDLDYGIDLYKPNKYFNFFEKFENSGKSVLIIKGNNKKWTIITSINNIIPRIDLANEYYNKIN